MCKLVKRRFSWKYNLGISRYKCILAFSYAIKNKKVLFELNCAEGSIIISIAFQYTSIYTTSSVGKMCMNNRTLHKSN